MNNIVLSAQLSPATFVAEAPLILRNYLYAFNAKDPVMLRFFIGDADDAALASARTVLTSLIRKEFFFLKELPLIADVSPGRPPACDAMIRTPDGPSGETVPGPPLLDANPMDWLDFVFSRTDHRTGETGYGQSVPVAPMAEAQKQTHEHWSKRPSKGSPLCYPPYRAAFSRRITGSEDKSWLAYFARHLEPLPERGRYLSIGCGGGSNEANLLALTSPPGQFDAFDFSQDRVRAATALAKKKGLSCLNCFTQDAHFLYLPENHYDAIMAYGILHHLYNLERLYWEIARSLKPGGLFLIYDYCGPSHMQFAPLQEQLIDNMVKMLPQQLRVMNSNPEYHKSGFSTPPLDLMNRLDYSEGIRAAEIAPLLPTRFTILDERGAGGTLLPHVFNDIENALDPGNAEHMAMVKALVDLEEDLLQRKVVPHDFRCFICRPVTSQVNS